MRTGKPPQNVTALTPAPPDPRPVACSENRPRPNMAGFEAEQPESVITVVSAEPANSQ